MKQGFVRVAAATPKIKVADCNYNRQRIIEQIREAQDKHTKIIVFPELCITGYTCGDLFLQRSLLEGAKESLLLIAKETIAVDMVIILGLPLVYQSKLYNCAAVIWKGRILGIVPKTHIPNYSEFYESRHFTKGAGFIGEIKLGDAWIPFGTDLLFCDENITECVIGVEICEDLWVPMPPGARHATAGATILANPSASDETTGKDKYRRTLVSSQSARLVSAYVYANAGEGESTTDLVFGGHNIIAENGLIITEAKRFANGIIYGDVDLEKIQVERQRLTTYHYDDSGYRRVYFGLREVDYGTRLLRPIDKTPFVPNSLEDRAMRCEEILMIQALGLKKRLEHTGLKHCVIAVSGGLDSTLALLVIVKAFDMLGLDRKGILGVTMPCFGTTDRTYQNAMGLMNSLEISIKEINIRDAVLVHFKDIGQDPEVHDITYENAQARERTQVIMDLANKINGLVIGTGDMSELALGWATYNGDHMSMYGVNASIPKTLVKYLVAYVMDENTDAPVSKYLKDIIATPVSPELLPPVEGVISQKTEDLVGPYTLHDFFLYYIMRFGFKPSKIYSLAKFAFEGDYDSEEIMKWLQVFIRRFFNQQFKRSCMPDGPKVGSVALSPRGDLRMPSDASAEMWLKELDLVKE